MQVPAGQDQQDPRRELVQLLMELHRAMVDPQTGAPITKTRAAEMMGLSRAALQLWTTEADYWAPPGSAALATVLDFYGATAQQRDRAWVLLGRCRAV